MTTCPACGHKFTAKKQPYTPEFEELWLLYDAPTRVPTASKSEAMKAWTQIESIRPNQARILTAVRRYLAQIDKDNSPACHPATWLRQGRYENFLPAEIIDPAPTNQAPASYPGWPPETAKNIIKHIGEPKFKTWLGDAIVTPGTMTDCAVITVNTDLKRSYLETKLASVLGATLGHFEVRLKS